MDVDRILVTPRWGGSVDDDGPRVDRCAEAFGAVLAAGAHVATPAGLLALVLAAAGCGRVGFEPMTTTDADPASDADPATDGLLGHDEDGDGVPDTRDVCPHLADPQQLDSDGDGVGDVCDPQPMLAAQTWVLFNPMTTSSAPFGLPAAWTQEPDALRMLDTGETSQLIAAIDLADVDIWVGYDVLGVGVVSRQLAIIVQDSGGGPYTYGELYQGDNAPYLSITHFDGSGFGSLSQSPGLAGFPSGPITLHLTARTTTPSFSLASRIGDVGASTGTVVPLYAGGDLLLLGTRRVAIDVRYVAIVATTTL